MELNDKVVLVILQSCLIPVHQSSACGLVHLG